MGIALSICPSHRAAGEFWRRRMPKNILVIVEAPLMGNCPDRETAIDSDILELADGVLGRSAVPC